MRIIGGQARGKRLVTPAGTQVRPTNDRIREALFSILGPVDDIVLIDGFAGTGAVGCEALSRGAAFCWFFEPLRAAHDIVRQNVEGIGAEDRAEVIQCTFARGLGRVDREPDLVFLDPPYGTGLAAEAVGLLGESPRLTEGALVVVEQARDDPPVAHDRFELDDERTYGSTRLRFLRVSFDL